MASQIVGVLRAILTADTSEYAKAMTAAGQSTAKVADSIEKNLAPRLSTVTAMVKGMFGASDIRRAEEYAMAVEAYGGVARLVESDQKKVNAALQQATAHYRALGEEVPDTLKKLQGQFDELAAAQKKAAEGATSWERAQKTINAETSTFTDGIKQMAIGYFTGEAALDAFKTAGKFAIDFLKDSITQAAEADRTQRKLTQALTDQGTALPGVFKLYDELAKKYGETTIYSSGLIKEQETMLAQVGDVMPAQMDRALEAVTNLAAGMGTDLASATTLVSKGFADNFTALKKVVPSIDEARAKSEGMAYVLDQINARFGGQALADANSYTGQMEKLKNQWSDFQEEVGKTVTQSGALQAFFDIAKRGIEVLVQKFSEMRIEWYAVQGLMLTMGEWFGVVAPKAPAAVDHTTAAFNRMKNSIGEIVAHLDRLGGGGGGSGDLVAQLDAARKALDALKPAQIAAINAGLTLNRSTKEIAESTGIAADVIGLYKDRLTAATAAQKTLAAEQKKAAQDHLNSMLADALAFEKEIADEKKAAELRKQQEQDLANILAKRVDLNKLPGSTKLGAPPTDPTVTQWMDQQYANAALRDAFKNQREMKGGITAAGLTKFGSGAGQVAMGALMGGGNLASSLGAYGATEGLKAATGGLVKSLTTDLVSGAAKTGIGAVLGNVIGGMIPFVGGLVGPLIGKLFGPSAGKKANTLRDSIKEQLGGDAKGAGLEELVGKYKETAAVGAAYQEFLAAKTEDTVKASAEKLQSAMANATTDVEAKAQRMATALDTVASATTKIAKGFTNELAPALKEIEGLRQKQKDAAASGDAEGAGALAVQVLEKQRDAAKANQGEFDRLSRITLASFNAYIGQGKSAIDAVQAVGPAIDELRASADAFGFAGSAAYDQLSRWRELTTANAPLLDQVSGLNELMSALGTLGALDAATFADLQAQGVAAFDQLTASGFTSQEASTQLAPLLQTILDTHEKTGMAIDDETQAIIDQAREDGALKEKQISDQQIMIAGFSALIKAVGGDVPDAFTKMAKSSKDTAKQVKSDADSAAKGVQDAFDDVDITIPVRYATSGDVVDPSELPQMARGGIVTSPTVALIGESGPEAVIPLDQAGGGGRTIVLETDGRAWARVHAPYVATEVQRLQLSR